MSKPQTHKVMGPPYTRPQRKGVKRNMMTRCPVTKNGKQCVSGRGHRTPHAFPRG